MVESKQIHHEMAPGLLARAGNIIYTYLFLRELKLTLELYTKL